MSDIFVYPWTLKFRWDDHCAPDMMMISLAKIISDTPPYEVPGGQGTYSLDASKNNWFARIEDNVLTITARSLTVYAPVIQAVATLVEYRFGLVRL